MLGPDDELVRIPWMLIVVNDVGHKHVEDVEFLDLCLEIANLHEVVHGLETVYYMVGIMVCILLKVPQGYLQKHIL